jgi:hypothetical protein
VGSLTFLVTGGKKRERTRGRKKTTKKEKKRKELTSLLYLIFFSSFPFVKRGREKRWILEATKWRFRLDVSGSFLGSEALSSSQNPEPHLY